jgi:hypothetical protein
MRRWAALVIIRSLGAVSGSMIGWISALFTSTTSNPSNSFSAAASFCPAPSTQTVAVTQDTYVREDQPETPFGTAIDLRVHSDTTRDRRTLLYFPLPSRPAGCVVSSAFLRLYATLVTSGRTIGAYRLASSPSWTETGVTWSTPAEHYGSPSDHLIGINDWLV